MIIACVYQPSKVYTIDYLKVFSRVFDEYHPEYKQVVFTNYSGSDIPKALEKILLKYNYPSWFSKLELFRNDIDENIFYCDLDNIIMKPLDEFFDYHQNNTDTPFMIRDVDYRLNRLQSAVMYIPKSKKSIVWDHFINNSNNLISDAGKFGDAKIIRETPGWSDLCLNYQDTFGLNSIVSYRLGFNGKDVSKSFIVAMHGQNEKPNESRFRHDPIVKEHFLRWMK